MSIIVATNRLRYNCQTRVGVETEEWWPHYQLDHQEICNGDSFEDFLKTDGWEITDDNKEKIIVETPGIEVPEEFDFERKWITVKRYDEDRDGPIYLEVCITEDEREWSEFYDWHCYN